MKSIHTFDVFAPTDEQEEAMNKDVYKRQKESSLITGVCVQESVAR